MIFVVPVICISITKSILPHSLFAPTVGKNVQRVVRACVVTVTTLVAISLIPKSSMSESLSFAKTAGLSVLLTDKVCVMPVNIVWLVNRPPKYFVSEIRLDGMLAENARTFAAWNTIERTRKRTLRMLVSTNRNIEKRYEHNKPNIIVVAGVPLPIRKLNALKTNAVGLVWRLSPPLSRVTSGKPSRSPMGIDAPIAVRSSNALPKTTLYQSRRGVATLPITLCLLASSAIAPSTITNLLRFHRFD
jgi:hypothetical protein